MLPGNTDASGMVRRRISFTSLRMTSTQQLICAVMEDYARALVGGYLTIKLFQVVEFIERHEDLFDLKGARVVDNVSVHFYLAGVAGKFGFSFRRSGDIFHG